MGQSELVKAGVIASLIATAPGVFSAAALAASGQSPAAGYPAPSGSGPTSESSCGLVVLNGVTTETRPVPSLKVLNSSSVKLPKIDNNVLAVSCTRDSVIPVPGDEKALKGHSKPFIINDGVRSGTLTLDKGKYNYAVSGGVLSKPEDQLVKANLKLMQGDADQVAKKKSDGNKVAGCLVGGLLTGFLAAAVSSKQARGGAAIAGFAAGCALGWTFAKDWSQKDKDGLEKASEDALNNPNGAMDWQAPESGQQVRFRSNAVADRTEEVEFQHLDNVEAPPPGSKILSRPYRTMARLPLRSSPDGTSTDNILGRYNQGQVVEVVGITPNGLWAMVGDGGVVIGYLPRNGLTDTGQALNVAQTERYYIDAPAAPAPARAAPAKGKAKAAVRPAPALAARMAPPVAQAQVKTVKVAATTQCKSLTAATGQQQQSKTGCNRPGGKWVFA